MRSLAAKYNNANPNEYVYLALLIAFDFYDEIIFLILIAQDYLSIKSL